MPGLLNSASDDEGDNPDEPRSRQRRKSDPPPARASDRWPEGWPRAYPEVNAETKSQWARFVGGTADGLSDRVSEVAPGQLPHNLECMGSVYVLVLTLDGRDAEYRIEDDEQNRR